MRVLILLFFVFTAAAEPFDISLPLTPQFNPDVLAKGEMSFTLSFVDKSNNFQLQVRNKTDDDHFIDEEVDHGIAMALSLGLGTDIDVGLYNSSDGGVLSLKYGIGSNNSGWGHSVILGYVHGISTGHGGNVLPEAEEDCGFLDIFCYMDIGNLFCFISCSDPMTYEYDYEADITGTLLAYMQSYKKTPALMLYWGAFYTDYDIGVRVTDNTGTNADSFESFGTDVFVLSTGLRWKVGKPDKDGQLSYLLVNLIPIKYSSRHDGEFDGEITISYINEF